MFRPHIRLNNRTYAKSIYIYRLEKTKSLYAGSCYRFFDWAKEQPDAASIIRRFFDNTTKLDRIDRIILPISDGVWLRYMTQLTYKGKIISDATIK